MIFWLLIGVVVLAPLPFASVHAWSWGAMACAVGGLLAAWGAHGIWNRRPAEIGFRGVWPLLVLFMIPVLWAAAQALPWAPPGWRHPLWSHAADALGTDLAGSVSLNPEATLSSLARLLTYGGIFWLALNLCRDPKRARQALLALAIAGSAYAAYGLFVEFSGARTILWFDKTAYRDDLTATFVNRNSYAAYAGLGALCASGLLFNLVSRSIAAGAPPKERLRRLIESVAGRGWVLILGWAVLVSALILTNSRAGLLSAVLGLGVLGFAMSLNRTGGIRRAIALGAMPLLAVAALYAVSGEIVDRRLAHAVADGSERRLVYGLTLDAIRTAPLLGTGYGSFEDVFRLHRGEEIESFYLYAHNTYLENASGLGLPAAACLFAAVAGLLGVALRGLRRRRRGALYPAVGCAATALVAAHSAVDFSLQIPAVAATYALIMGVACAQSWPRARR